MGLKKKYLKSKTLCKVSFELSKEESNQAKKVTLVGEFNAWDKSNKAMKKLKNGNFQCVVELEPGREYQFRYLMDNDVWGNDWKADRYVRSDYGNCENSVVIV